MLCDVYDNHIYKLYLLHLLTERTPNQSISHKRLPTWKEHVKFVDSKPYKAWYLIYDEWVRGSIYLTKRSEVGIAIFKDERRKGYASKALAMLKKKHKGKLYANINPKNRASIAFFKKHGFTPLQVTYVSK